MNGWRSYIISIDGVDGSSKSTIGRYLAFDLGIPVIETDMFLIKDSEFEYRYEDISNLIESRINSDRPVIIEGVFMLRLLEKLSYESNYKVFCRKLGHYGSCTWKSRFSSYYKSYKPRSISDSIYKWIDD